MLTSETTLHYQSLGYDYTGRSQILNEKDPEKTPIPCNAILIRDKANKYSNRMDLYGTVVEEISEGKDYFDSHDFASDDYLLGTHAASKNCPGIENVTMRVHKHKNRFSTETVSVNYQDEIYAHTRDQRAAYFQDDYSINSLLPDFDDEMDELGEMDPGRCYAVINFDRYTPEQALAVAQAEGLEDFDPTMAKSFSLAEVFESSRNRKIARTKVRKIGFL